MTSWYETTKNVAGKSRKVGNAYAVITHPTNGWKWHILKSWQADNSREYSRWFCYVEGDYNEMGDVYCREVRSALMHPDAEKYVKFDESVFNTFGEFMAWAFGER